MNKFLLLIAFIFTGLTAVHAQTKSAALSIGGEFGFPAGAASNVYGSVLGGSLKLELPVAKSNFNVTITSGYSIYLTKFNYAGPYSSSFYIPVEIGGRYYFSKLGYFEGDAGFSAKASGNFTPSSMAFIYSPVIGFSAPLYKRRSTIDIGLRYESRAASGNSIDQVALRVAYRFGL